MSIIISIGIGVLASSVASLVFLGAMSKLKPKIEISPYISTNVGEDGKQRYRVKFVNRSHRAAIDIRARLKISKPISIPKGVIVNSNEIKLSTSYVFELPGYRPNDPEAQYAWRLVTLDDLDAMWDDDTSQYLVLQLIAKDSLSGFSRVFVQRFHTKRNSIINGSHVFGESLEVN